MSTLRDLRMRQAAQQLSVGQLSVDQVARNVGYESRSSFVRAFRKVHGTDPSNYRASAGADEATRLDSAVPFSKAS
jgi:AraC family transcriptional activator of mtrCDE